MLPNIDLRIQNIVKALEQVIIPALPHGEKLAKDQAGLCIGHLNMIARQWKLSAAFEATSLAAMEALGKRLVPLVDPVFAAQITATLDSVAGTARDDPDAMEAAIVELGGTIDKAILGGDGRFALPPAAWTAILDYGDRQSLRERSWFADNGLDPDRLTLPGIAEVVRL